MQTQMLFLDGKAILVDKIAYIDFSEAGIEVTDPRVKVILGDGLAILIKDRDAIKHLIQAFVPQGAQGKYVSKIKVASIIPGREN